MAKEKKLCNCIFIAATLEMTALVYKYVETSESCLSNFSRFSCACNELCSAFSPHTFQFVPHFFRTVANLKVSFSCQGNVMKVPTSFFLHINALYGRISDSSFRFHDHRISVILVSSFAFLIKKTELRKLQKGSPEERRKLNSIVSQVAQPN